MSVLDGVDVAADALLERRLLPPLLAPQPALARQAEGLLGPRAMLQEAARGPEPHSWHLLHALPVVIFKCPLRGLACAPRGPLVSQDEARVKRMGRGEKKKED